MGHQNIQTKSVLFIQSIKMYFKSIINKAAKFLQKRQTLLKFNKSINLNILGLSYSSILVVSILMV